MVVVHPVWADEYQTANELLARVDSAESENLSPDIRAAYDALKESLNSAENLYNEYQSELNENLDAMRETEQSFENRMLGGATMGATGIGGQMLASGLAEQAADDAAAMDMNAYLATFKCDYGMGLNINGGETNITLPGANILLPLRNEYIELATRLRQAKESLGLPLGIESVEILDPTDANLYDNAAVGVTDYALDTAAERAASTETDEKIQTGAITAGVGAAAGLVGNLIINRDAPKERSREITAEYEKNKREIDNEIAENEQALTQAIEDNSKLVEEYNALLRLHKEFVLTITETECIPEFQEYIDYINGLDYITDMMTDASELVIEYDLDEMRAAYTECADAAALRRQIAECEAQEYHEWVDGECVDNTPQCDQGYHLDENGECVPDAVAGDDGTDGTGGTDTDDDDDNDGVDDGLDDDNEDANDDEDIVITGDLSCDAITDQSECENSESDCYWNNGTCMSMACPDENPRFSSARGKRVGDACTYGNVARGHIFKYAAGTMRGGVDVGGTCSCSADACADGYKLESGMCTNCADGYHKNENDECVPDETSVDDTDNEDITLPICPYEEFQANWEITNADTCVDFCKKRAQEQNCQYQGATFSNNICRCSPSKTSDLPPLVYYQVCGNDQGKTDGDEICVDEFFEDTRVQPNQAIALASEYARVKENDENIICNETPRNCRINIVTNGDCIQCTSRGAEKKYYEFRFRRVDATGDANIQQSVLTSLCKLYDTNVSVGKAGFIPGNPITPGSAFCRTDDSTVCQKINDSAARFGYHAQMGLVEVSDRRSVTQQHDDVCVLLRSVTSVDNLRTMDDIDPYYFKNQGIQLQLGTDIENRICTYVQNTIHPTALTDCRCNDNTTPIRDVTSRLTVGPNDDVITCRINGQTVDFVFDDLSEASNINRRAGEQAMDCIVQGGTYDGKHCLHLNQEQCNALANANLQSCPECRKVKWNPDEEICELPNSESAQNLKRGLEITGQVALITGAAALTIVTGGGGAGIVVMVGLETVGGAMSVVAMDKQHEAAYDFLTESNRCKDPSCAEDLIKTNLQRLANLLKNFDDVQIAAIDTELERLIELLPNDSKLFTEFESLSPADLQKGFFDPESWEPEDVWETVGNVLSITTVIASIGSAALRQLTRATRAITTRVNTGTRAVTISNKADDVFSLTRAQAKRLDDLALEEQRLLARQAQNPGAREAAEIRSNLTRVRQERQTLLNQLGNPSEEALNAAKAEAYRLDDLQQAEAELARLQQERANLYTTNRNGQQVLRNGRTRHDVTALDNQIAAQQQRIAADAVGAGARTGGASDDAARSADDATDAARGADAANDATDSADDAARAGTRGAGGAANAARSATEQASDMLNNSGFRAALDEFEQTGKINAVFPRDAVSDDAWNVINSNLESRGIRMRSGTSGGRDIMAFDNIPDHPAAIARLRNRASKRFNEYFDTLKTTGRGVSWPASRLTDDEWKIVNDSLADDGIRLQRIDNRMIMEEIPNHPATVARQQARDAARAGDAADDAARGADATDAASVSDDAVRANVNSREVNYILTNSERATYRNTPAYVYQPKGLKESEAGNIAEMINDEGNYYAAILNKEGYNGADYMVITMSKSDADKMRYSWSGSDLTYPIDNSQNMARLRQQIGNPITSIRGTPVVIETMSDFGRVSGRAIVMVRVGNKKIPFYISSGSAGKTDVPTGKWEFFGGITEEKGWFRKGGTIKEINNHYDSAELKQIANALDNTIGDLRDTELVLKTIGRQELNGLGKVATCQNAPAISLETINQSFPKPVQRNGFARDLDAIKNYLRSL